MREAVKINARRSLRHEDCHESLAISSLGGGRDEEEEN